MYMKNNDFHYKNNRLQQLKGFYYTVLKGSVVKAANHLGLSQSTVSAQISSLERDLGTKLFDRVGKYLEVNANGKLLYKMSVESIQRLDTLFEDFSLKQKEQILSLDISATHISMVYILPKILRKYRDKCPDVKLTIRNIDKEQAMGKLYANQTDLCLYPYFEVPPECDFYHVADYDPVLLVPKNHPLTKKQSMTLEDVTEYNLIRLEPHLVTLPIFEEVTQNYKLVNGNIKLESGDWEILKQLVKANLGVTFASDVCLDESDTDIVGIPVIRYFPKMSYGFCLKKGRYLQQHVQDFLDIVRNNAVVPGDGIEPPTQGFSVPCSTN